MNFDPDKSAAELSMRGIAWAELDGAYKTLDDATKSILSGIATNFEGSEAFKEREARASDEYRYQHLKSLSEARTKATIAKVNYDVYKTWIDMKRTELSYQKAEMGIR
jgi:hypothetical protein